MRLIPNFQTLAIFEKLIIKFTIKKNLQIIEFKMIK